MAGSLIPCLPDSRRPAKRRSKFSTPATEVVPAAAVSDRQALLGGAAGWNYQSPQSVCAVSIRTHRKRRLIVALVADLKVERGILSVIREVDFGSRCRRYHCAPK